MKKSEIAKWLFYYYLIGTTLLGLIIIILGPENSFLSLKDSLGIFAIIIPVFIGQLTIIFQWSIDQAGKSKSTLEKNINISPILVKLPPVIVVSIFSIAILLRGLGILYDWQFQVDESQFKLLVTFAMSILNATTIYLISFFYRPSEKKE